MGGYVGTTKRDIDYLIDSVMEPGVSVKREIRTKTILTDACRVNILYHFYKNNDKLFSLRILPKSDFKSTDFYQLENLEVSILYDREASDYLCKGDDGFRSARVLCQLAEKMYETQNALKDLKPVFSNQNEMKLEISNRYKNCAKFRNLKIHF